MRMILNLGGGYPPMKTEYKQPIMEIISVEPVFCTGSGEPTPGQNETPLIFY